MLEQLSSSITPCPPSDNRIRVVPDDLYSVLKTRIQVSVSQSGSSPQMDYVPLAYHDQAVAFLSNHRSIRQILDEICEINRELLRRRKKL